MQTHELGSRGAPSSQCPLSLQAPRVYSPLYPPQRLMRASPGYCSLLRVLYVRSLLAFVKRLRALFCSCSACACFSLVACVSFGVEIGAAALNKYRG